MTSARDTDPKPLFYEPGASWLWVLSGPAEWFRHGRRRHRFAAVIARLRAVVELALACAALVATGLSWTHTRSTVAVAPVADGQPVTTSLIYHPQQLVLTLLLATIAGVLAVVGAARLRRARAV